MAGSTTAIARNTGWNGDHDNPNYLSRLRYNTMYVDRIVERMLTTAPDGADLTSWRY